MSPIGLKFNDNVFPTVKAHISMLMWKKSTANNISLY